MQSYFKLMQDGISHFCYCRPLSPNQIAARMTDTESQAYLLRWHLITCPRYAYHKPPFGVENACEFLWLVEEDDEDDRLLKSTRLELRTSVSPLPSQENLGWIRISNCCQILLGWSPLNECLYTKQGRSLF